ncbi:MAG: HAD-IC family P-type ATPase, partial [Muribaculaceae bacterium]|nr:HAD-IC family P-type ATPase [Muribaculaceae bacterium]
VMEGHGVRRVNAVGDATENGKVFTAAQIDNSVKTPLNEQLERLGRLISIASYVIAGLIVAGRLLMYFIQYGEHWEWVDFVSYLLQTVMIAVTLVVVSVPEGLPMAVTLSLAYSMRRMLRTNNLVRKMHACETMGATTVICTDKTGTLTQNQMRVNQTDFYNLPDGVLDGSRAALTVAEGIAVNSTAQLDLTDPDRPKVLGNPTEGALLLWLHGAGIDWQALRAGVKVEAELPFTTERKYMATVVADGNGRRTLYVKGAPEIVLGLCSRVAGDVSRDAIAARLLQFQSQAMRTLGFAYRDLAPGDPNPIVDGALTPGDLEFIGVAAIADPVRADVPAAVKECIDAGIAIKIVTGDTPATAREIGRQIGLWTDADGDEAMITGPEFDALTDEELLKRVDSMKIIARARPMDKKRLVEALQARNEVVAVTGDGTNDAPALKAAHVGLSMGDGTSVAKEASDITIVDNSFASICRAVMWGRSLYRNIQRFILFQLTV